MIGIYVLKALFDRMVGEPVRHKGVRFVHDNTNTRPLPRKFTDAELRKLTTTTNLKITNQINVKPKVPLQTTTPTNIRYNPYLK